MRAVLIAVMVVAGLVEFIVRWVFLAAIWLTVAPGMILFMFMDVCEIPFSYLYQPTCWKMAERMLS